MAGKRKMRYWIGDAGAIVHITNSSAGIYNCANSPKISKVVMGNKVKIDKEEVWTLKIRL